MHGLSERAQELIALEERYGAHNYHPLDLVVERAEGVWLWDVGGDKYLDCISAYSAVNQGHCHPRIFAAMVDQAKKVTLTSRAMRNDRMPGFLEKLTRLCGFDMALPMNTGVEAVETAIKLARRWGYRVKGIRRQTPPRSSCSRITFTDARRRSSARARRPNTASTSDRSTPGFVPVKYGDFDALERAITPNTCAILIEPIQGEGGVIVPPEGFLKRVWALCAKSIKCSSSPTRFKRASAAPAICSPATTTASSRIFLLVGKALGGGFYPVSAALANEPMMSLFQPGDHGSTFGGNPLGSAVADAALDVIVDEKLAQRARYAGAKIMQGLRAIASPLIKEIRGRGLLIGIELTDTGAHLIRSAARTRRCGQRYAGYGAAHRTAARHRRRCDRLLPGTIQGRHRVHRVRHLEEVPCGRRRARTTSGPR